MKVCSSTQFYDTVVRFTIYSLLCLLHTDLVVLFSVFSQNIKITNLLASSIKHMRLFVFFRSTLHALSTQIFWQSGEGWRNPRQTETARATVNWLWVRFIHALCVSRKGTALRNVLAEFIKKDQVAMLFFFFFFYFLQYTSPRRTFRFQAASWSEHLPCCELCSQSLSSCCLCLWVLRKKSCCQSGRIEGFYRMQILFIPKTSKYNIICTQIYIV